MADIMVVITFLVSFLVKPGTLFVFGPLLLLPLAAVA